MANLNQASSRSQYQQNLDAIGQLGQSEADFEDLSTPMEQAAGAFILRVQQNMTDKKISVSGKSSDSLKVKIIDGQHSQVTADPVLFFQDLGVNPSGESLYPGTTFGYTTKYPPIQPLLDWIKARQIQSEYNPKYGSEKAFEGMDEEEKQKQLAFAMRYSIMHKKGIPPKNIMFKEVQQYVDDLVQLVMATTASGVLGQLTFSTPGTSTRGATRIYTPSSPNPNVK
ncbi:hypothetical protein [Pedobacter sp. L105]|uniref:hypothetical protein n=1 Tax=Pedobacter sp. L105 TaxID=1641871 RepID=UPI00131E2DC2|nr:hypothetical protein [Pedobacter sp. L105]